MRQAALKNVGRRLSLPAGNASHAQFRKRQWQGNAAEVASPAFTIDRNGDVPGSRFEQTAHNLDAEALAMLRLVLVAHGARQTSI
jgi:hypothetical protein